MKIIAVTACAAGVAHTFMAKKKLEDAAKKLGHEIKVETQGAGGIEDELTPRDISDADILILAIDIEISKRDRFKDMKKVEVPIITVLKSPEALLKKIEAKLNE
ncbi:PTS system IIB component (Fru family) [Trichococcus patagoniensis]|uniref:PTS system IIB component (Fru family) n=1 Tax=Trichococcus patagoniensis TaxID=382641 RepID=A0A2T5IJN9_9LACT|nr:fructose PTS transporter subunit IIB [Trichococcus patagoniensis]PTQ84027.1 PTS system IIB component (Fru family) [Trichococcus patagoniensis]